MWLIYLIESYIWQNYPPYPGSVRAIIEAYLATAVFLFVTVGAPFVLVEAYYITAKSTTQVVSIARPKATEDTHLNLPDRLSRLTGRRRL